MSDHLDDRAACQGLDGGIFFVERGESTAAAKRVCASCPVARQCFEGSVDRGDEFGIWGGVGENEGRLLAKQYQRGGAAWPRAWANWWSRLQASVAGERYEVVNRNSENATHGLRSTYARGCRCDPCVFAAMLNTREDTAASLRQRLVSGAPRPASAAVGGADGQGYRDGPGEPEIEREREARIQANTSDAFAFIFSVRTENARASGVA